MVVLSIIVALLVSLPQSSDQSFSPMYGIFDDSEATREQKLEYVQLLNEFMPDKFVRRIDDALLERLSTVFHQFEDAQGFAPAGGMLYMLNRRGEVGNVRFRTVSNPETFDAFVAMHAAKRGSTVEVTRTGNNVLMTVPGPGEKRPSGATVRWMDSHFSYGKGIVTWGAEAFSTPFDRLAAIVEKCTGYEWCVYGRPSEIPESHKSAFLQAVWLHSAVASQQWDAENDGDYTVRRSLSDLRLELTRRFFSDVDEVVAGKHSGDLGAGFHGHFSLAIRPGSELSQHVRQLSRGGTFVHTLPDNPVWSASFNIGIPEQGKSVLHAALKNSRWAGTSAATAISRQLDRGVIAGGVVSVTDSEGNVTVQGQIESDATDREIQSFISPLGGLQQGDGTSSIRISAVEPDELLRNFYLNVRADSNLERVAFESYRGDAIRLATEKVPGKTIADVPDRAWVELVNVKADFRTLGDLPPEAEVRRLFVKCEQLYHDSIAQPYRDRYRLVQEPLLDEFISVAPKLRSDGNWKLEFVIRALRNGERIVADLSLGRELYGLLLARKHTSVATMPRLPKPPLRNKP